MFEQTSEYRWSTWATPKGNIMLRRAGMSWFNPAAYARLLMQGGVFAAALASCRPAPSR